MDGRQGSEGSDCAWDTVDMDDVGGSGRAADEHPVVYGFQLSPARQGRISPSSSLHDGSSSSAQSSYCALDMLDGRTDSYGSVESYVSCLSPTSFASRQGSLSFAVEQQRVHDRRNGMAGTTLFNSKLRRQSKQELPEDDRERAELDVDTDEPVMRSLSASTDPVEIPLRKMATMLIAGSQNAALPN